MKFWRGKGKKELSLMITSPTYSMRSIDAAGPMNDGDIIHFLYSDLLKKGFGLRFIVISIDLCHQKHWGPYYCGRWATYIESYEASDLVHIHGFRKTVLGDKDLSRKEYAITGMTEFLSGMPYKEWKIALRILNSIQEERIENRIKNPRDNRSQKFEDDILDVALSKIITRVNAVMNEQLYWGISDNDSNYLIF